MSGPRYVGFSIGYFDLEASGLNGSYGRLLTASCQHSEDGDLWTARCDEKASRCKTHPTQPWCDFNLALNIRDHLLSHDVLVSWNGKRGWNSKGRSGFDVPVLNARLISPGHPDAKIVGRYVKHIDLLKEIRRHIELHSFRLQAVQEFLDLQEEKSRILPDKWHGAQANDRASIDYILDHNVRDVQVLRLVFEEMRVAGLLERPTW